MQQRLRSKSIAKQKAADYNKYVAETRRQEFEDNVKEKIQNDVVKSKLFND